MKTKMCLLFGACVMLMALFAVPAFAAETGNAAGKVVDLVTNAGVGGVTVVARCSVEFEEDKPYERVEATTSADGSYTLKKLLAERYYGLSFAKVGYIVEARWQTATVTGKTKRVSDIALCPIPAAHGVYRLSNETVQFLQRFMRDPSARPAHPLTYEPLPQATYTKTSVPGKEGEFTREFTVSCETVIPQILHKHKRAPGEVLLILSDPSDPVVTLRRVHEKADISSGERRFLAEDACWVLQSAFEMRGGNARGTVMYTGTSLAGGAGYYNLPSDHYVLILPSGELAVTPLFEVVDTVSGDDITRCKNILTIMRHEIAAFRQQNGRLPTYEEFNEMKYDGHPLAGCYNPFSTNSFSKDADVLKLKKGNSYVVLDDYERLTGWLYSSSTGELWPATSSGNGEANW